MARTAKYTASVSAMVTDDQKAFLLGAAEIEQVSEGDVVRALLDKGIDGSGLTPAEVGARIGKGRELLAARKGGQ